MMAPNAIGTTNTCQEKIRCMVCFMTPLAHTIPISAHPNATPNMDAIKPSRQDSSSTEAYSCPFFAPMVRSRASVRRRWATSTWKVLAMTSAATSMASTPKHSRKMVTMLVSPTPMLFM